MQSVAAYWSAVSLAPLPSRRLTPLPLSPSLVSPSPTLSLFHPLHLPLLVIPALVTPDTAIIHRAFCPNRLCFHPLSHNPRRPAPSLPWDSLSLTGGIMLSRWGADWIQLWGANPAVRSL